MFDAEKHTGYYWCTFAQTLTDMVCMNVSVKLEVLCSPTSHPRSKAWAPSVPSRFSRDFSKCLMNIKISTQVRIIMIIKKIHISVKVFFFHFFIIPFQSWSVWCFYTFKCKWNGGCRDFMFYLICVLPNRGLVLIPDHFSLVRHAARWNLLHFCHHHCFWLPLPPGWYCHVSRTSLDDTPKKTTGR